MLKHSLPSFLVFFYISYRAQRPRSDDVRAAAPLWIGTGLAVQQLEFDGALASSSLLSRRRRASRNRANRNYSRADLEPFRVLPARALFMGGRHVDRQRPGLRAKHALLLRGRSS